MSHTRDDQTPTTILFFPTWQQTYIMTKKTESISSPHQERTQQWPQRDALVVLVSCDGGDAWEVRCEIGDGMDRGLVDGWMDDVLT
jgi:hypothetical protein